MSNFNETSDFAAFCRYKQWESESHRSEGIQPQQTARPQHPTQAQRPTLQRPSPTRPQIYRQTPPPNPSELAVLFRCYNELKKRVDDIFAVLNNVQTTSEETKTTLVGNMERMDRFEIFGRRILKEASQPSNGSSSQPQPSSNSPPFTQHPSQQQPSNPPPFSQYTSQQQTASHPQNQYGQAPNAAPPAPQPSYAQPPSQAPDSYTDPNYIDYNVFSEFMASDT